jgi:hypothetical protein
MLMAKKHYDQVDMLCLHINQLEKRLEVLEQMLYNSQQHVVANAHPLPQIPEPLVTPTPHLEKQDDTKQQQSIPYYASRRRFVM